MKPGHRADCSCCLFWNEDKEEISEPSPAQYIPTICNKCGIELFVGAFPYCKGRPEDHGPYRQHIFPPCEVDLGKQGKVVISSVMDIRRLEKESERRAANGEGQLMVWRDFSQDRSNGDRNSLGENNQISPREFMKRKGRGGITTKRGGDYR